jgi:hypothetical protein
VKINLYDSSSPGRLLSANQKETLAGRNSNAINIKIEIFTNEKLRERIGSV